MTAGNPRLGQTPPALTSLGAVGGARGVSAGALRIFVEFITRYDKAALAQLEGDLRNAEFYQKNSQIAEEKRLKRLTEVRKKLTESDLIGKTKLDAAGRKEIKQIELLASSRSTANRNEAKTRQAQLVTALQSRGFNQKEIELLTTRSKLTKEQARLERQQSSGKATQNRLTQQQVMLEGQISKIQGIRANFLPKLQGLAIGAIGGIFGGAVLGVGFQLAQSGLEKLGDLLQDIIDPARHAKEAVADLSKAVSELADAKKISDLRAASEIVASFGVGGAEGDRLAEALAEVAVMQRLIDSLKTESQTIEASGHMEALRANLLKLVTENVRNAAKNNETYHTTVEKVTSGTRTSAVVVHEYVGALRLEDVALARLNVLLGIHTDEASKAAAADERLAAAQQLAAYAADRFAAAIDSYVASRRAAADTAIENLGDQPSAKTLSLEAAIERLQGGGGNAAGLRANSEERALILLRQRLRLLGTNIDLEKFSGKFLLEAINAKISAIQKEGDAQDRLNSLLDHQYNISKQIRRQTGESVADFVERRAQEQRQQLAEGARLEREQLIASLEDQQAKVEDEVALVENAQQRKDMLAQAGTSKRLKELQKQLEASKKADAKELANRKKAIEDRFAAEKKAAEDAVRLSSETENKKFRIAISAVKSIEDLLDLSAEVQGRKAALTFLKAFGPALVNAGLMTDRQLSSAITTLMASISAFENQRNLIFTGHPTGRGPAEFQHGGIIELRNSRSPFGQNIRTGESGTELGVILSNKVTAALRQQVRGADQVGPFYMYGSVDPLGDRFRFKRMVKEAVQEALR